MTKPRCLAIALFYNDDDIAADHLDHMIANHHDIVVWDHGSTDGTAAVLDEYERRGAVRERHFLPRTLDFYKVFEHVSRHVIDTLAKDYDWISFPESDEFLEGPDRTKSYYEHVCDVAESPFDWLRFHNMVHWWTDKDDQNVVSPRARVKHYSVWHDCPPRVYAWRARCSNIRIFNHNDALGVQHPTMFKTCHYQWRSEVQAMKRIARVRGLSKNGSNVHFDNLADLEKLRIPAKWLHHDNGGELSLLQTVDFRKMYGV